MHGGLHGAQRPLAGPRETRTPSGLHGAQHPLAGPPGVPCCWAARGGPGRSHPSAVLVDTCHLHSLQVSVRLSVGHRRVLPQVCQSQ